MSLQSAPRRHPDFEKQPYPGYGGPQRPQMYGEYPFDLKNLN